MVPGVTSCVQPLGVFAKHDQVDVLVGSRDARERVDRTPARVQLQFLAQRHVGRAPAFALGGHQWTLQANAVALEAVHYVLGQGIAELLCSAGSGKNRLPLNGGSSGF
jgi:hypothetical protein